MNEQLELHTSSPSQPQPQQQQQQQVQPLPQPAVQQPLCGLGIGCPPHWVAPRVVCRQCLEKDLHEARMALRVEEVWKAEQEQRLRQATVRHKAAARALAARAAAVADVASLRRQAETQRQERQRLQDACREQRLTIEALRAKMGGGEAAAPSSPGPSPPPFPPQDIFVAQRLAKERRARIDDLLKVVPLKPCDHKLHRGIVICDGLCVPVAVSLDSLRAFSEQRLSAALGILCRVLSLLSNILQVPLPYAMSEKGSYSTIAVRISGGDPDAPHQPAAKGATSLASLSWWNSIVEAVSHFTAGPADRHTSFFAGDAVSRVVALPLWLHDHADSKHLSSFLRGLAALNANIIALLRSHRWLVKPHVCVTDMLPQEEGGSGLPTAATAFLLAECLAAFLHKPRPCLVPVGYPVWRAYAGKSSIPGSDLHSGQYFGTFWSTQKVYCVRFLVHFAAHRVVSAKIWLGTAHDMSREVVKSHKMSGGWDGSGEFEAEAVDEPFGGRLTVKGRATSDTLTPGVLGEWKLCCDGSITEGTINLRMFTLRYLDITPHSHSQQSQTGLTQPDHRPAPASPIGSSATVLNADAFAFQQSTYFGSKQSRANRNDMPRVASEGGSDGWELVDDF